MRRFWPLLLFVIIALIAISAYQPIKPSNNVLNNEPQRIISLAPSITETVYALGLGDKVVAVTDYCDYPSDVLSLAKVGGFINPNLEAIVALQPDLVILLANQTKTVEQLQQLNIPLLTVRNTTLNDIQQAISLIGQQTQHQTQAQQLLDDIELQINTIQQHVAELQQPRVMIAIGHSIGSEQIESIYIAGQHDFYNDLITLAGGQNVYQDKKIKVPSLSTEGILQLNPQVILDIFPEADDHDAKLDQVLQQWQNLKYVDAVKNNRVHIIEQDYATIPGPRVFQLLKQMAQLIHPELDWEDYPS